MKRTRASLTAAAVLAAALALSACSSGDAMDGMDHESGSSGSSSSDASADFVDADVAFASEMVVHHRQAVEMADVLLDKDGADSRVTALAERIKAAQQPEIDAMTGWLDAWGEPAESMEGHDMDGMSGAMTEEDMAALEDATGADADRLFLTQMTLHHEGAIEMAEEEIESGENPEAIELAEKIVSDQTAEIREMDDLLAAL